MLGDTLRVIRRRNNMTQQQVADYLGVDRSTYTFYETGTTKPSVDTAVRLAELYNVSVGSLLGHGTDEPVNEDMLSCAMPVDKSAAQSGQDQLLLEAFRKLPSEKKKLVIEMVQSLLPKDEM